MLSQSAVDGHGNYIRIRCGFGPEVIKKNKRHHMRRQAGLLALCGVLCMLSLPASSGIIPFYISISRPDSDSFVTITASNVDNVEFEALILQVNADLTTTNWVSVQTNYEITVPATYFGYRVSPAHSPRFFRVLGIP